MAKFPQMGLGLSLISGLWGSMRVLPDDKTEIAHSVVGKPIPRESVHQRALWSSQLHRKSQSDRGLKRAVKFRHKHGCLDIIQKGLSLAAGCKLQAVVVLRLLPIIYVVT